MRVDDYRQIMDFFFGGQDIPEELEREFRTWLARYGDDPQIVQQLESQWEHAPHDIDGIDIPEGLSTLHRKIAKEKESYHGRLRKVLKASAVAVCAGLTFLSGYVVSALGDDVHRETVLMASQDGIGMYSLPDGTRVWLNKESWLKYGDDFGKKNRTVRMEGEAYFDVTEDSSSPFVVKMNDDMEVKVMGTTFNACSYEGDNVLDVILIKGKVQIVDRNSGEKVILRPDQRCVKSLEGISISQIDADACCRWYEKKIIFDNARLGDVLENISHRYRIEILPNIGMLADKRMSMTISDEPIGDVMFVLSSILPVKCSLQERKLIMENTEK